MPELRHFLVATDFSPCSEAALREALTLAARTGARVDVLHVWSAPYFGPGYGYDGAPVLEPAAHASLFDKIRENAVAEMQAFLARVPAPPGVALTSRIESGDPARKLLESVEAERPDLVVIGTHGRTGARRWLIGSVAERVVRHSPAPVLTVPAPADAG
ncbi:MAG: universal stress protein [Deltaproteobacteria bacterium]|nr:universal stress protein [Deltaproteobacteria bacterium]